MKINNELLSNWRSLGILFSGAPDQFADPEKTILESLPLVLSDSKITFLISNWISQHGDVIHCERLLCLAKSKNLSYDEWMTLGAVVEYSVLAGHKLEALTRYIKSKIKKGRTVKTAEYMSLPITLGQCPPEPIFERYGIKVPTIEDMSSKITDIKLIIKTNQWIKNRIFFGCNWRADIYTSLSQHKNQKKRMTTYRLAKDLGCSNETALRIRKNFELLAC